MENKTVKVDPDTHEEVVAYTQHSGGKIGAFYDLAAKEKLERLPKKEKAKYNSHRVRI